MILITSHREYSHQSKEAGIYCDHLCTIKAYIPLLCKKVALGPGIGLAPQRHYFALGIPTCWYLKMLKFAFYPTQNPNASQWNIGCVGSLVLGLCIGHVHLIFFVRISFALGSRRKCSFQWNMGLRPNDSSFLLVFCFINLGFQNMCHGLLVLLIWHNKGTCMTTPLQRHFNGVPW